MRVKDVRVWIETSDSIKYQMVFLNHTADYFASIERVLYGIASACSFTQAI